MRFKAGYMGVCVVTLALLGGIAFGFIGNIEHENTTERGYRPLADATGLFNASNDRIYTDYIPNSNYTGWTAGTVSFTPTSTANPYYVITVPGTSTTMTVDLNAYNSTHQVQNKTFQAPNIYEGYNMKLSDIFADKGINIQNLQNIRVGLTDAGYLEYTYFNMYGYIPKSMVQANPSNIGVYDGSLTYRKTVADISNPGVPITADFTYSGSSFIINAVSWGILPTNPVYRQYCDDMDYFSTGGVSAIAGEISYDAPSNTHKEIWLEVNPSNGVVICYSQQNGIVTTEFSSTIDDCTIGWANHTYYPSSNGEGWVAWALTPGSPYYILEITPWTYNDFNSSHSAVPFENTITISYDVGAVGDYVKIANGFSLPADGSTEWTNGYDNHSLDIVFNGASSLSASSDYTITFYDGDDTTTTVNVSNNNITIGGISYGSWDSYVIRGSTEGVYFIPIISFGNYQNYTLGTPVKIMDLNGGDIVKVGLSGTAPGFSIENTSVWMDQYGVVMNAPNLDLRTYFPVSSYPILSMRLKDFTVFGSSITINGITYQMDGEFIVIPTEDPEDVDPKYRLKELTVIWEDGNTSFSVGNDTVYSGATTSNTVSMTGGWYFTASALEGYDYNTTKMNWDVGHWGMDTTQFIVVYEGLLIAGALIFRKAGGKALDYLVLLFAGFTGLIMV